MHRRNRHAEHGDGASTAPPAPRTRRRGRRLLAGLAGAAAVAMIGSPAAAGPPAVVDEGTYDQVYVVPAEEFFCGVEVTFHEVGSWATPAATG